MRCQSNCTHVLKERTIQVDNTDAPSHVQINTRDHKLTVTHGFDWGLKLVHVVIDALLCKIKFYSGVFLEAQRLFEHEYQLYYCQASQQGRKVLTCKC